MTTNSNITFGDIADGPRALLCVTTRSEEGLTLQFLSPSGDSVKEASNGRLFVTKGQQIVRLNHNASAETATPPETGSYCCSVRDGDADAQTSCVNIEN